MLHYTAKAGKTLSKLGAEPHSYRSPRLSYPTKIQKRFMTDHYATLGVSSTASASEIKKAFFEKAKKVHPDVNKGDPHAQKKFVDLSAAYEVLKNKDKRARYDQERQFGGGGFGNYGGQTHYQQQHQQSGSHYQHQQQQQYNQGSYNPYRGGYNPYANGGDSSSNPYYQTHTNQQNGDEFMRWYRSQFGDAFREFDEFNRGQTTIIEERMPDGSVRIRILKRGGPGGAGGFGGAGGPNSGANPFGSGFGRGARYQQQTQQQQQQGNTPRPEDVLSALFGRGAAGKFFGSLFRDGFGNAGNDGYNSSSSSNSSGHIPFGSGGLDFPALRISELSTNEDEISFSLTNSSHVGLLSHRVLSGTQGDVLTCTRDSQVLAKARFYQKDGKDRILIENGESKRLATIESVGSAPESASSSPNSGPTFLRQLKNALSLHYKILDESDRPSGHLSVSPFRRTIQYFDTQGNQVAVAERKDVEQQDIRRPTRDDWELQILDERLFDASVYVFTSAFSTLAERKSSNPIQGAHVIVKALRNKLSL